MKRRSNTIPAIAVVLLLAVAAAVAGCKSDTANPAATQAPAAADGAALLQERCSVCHSADKARQAKKTSDQWETTVTRMIGKGAQLTTDEKTVLVDYLATTYGP